MKEFKGYARVGKVIGDVMEITESFCVIEPFKTNKIGKPKKFLAFKIGLQKIELIEFGSFNPSNISHSPKGKVLRVL